MHQSQVDAKKKRLPANATQATTARVLCPISNDFMCLFDFPLAARYVAPEPADCQSLKKRKKMHPAFTSSVCCQMLTHGHLYCVLALPSKQSAQVSLKLRELKDFDSMGCIMLAEEVGAGVSSLAF